MIKDLIIQLIIQANENLRATDSKNQQMYYLFIVLSGFYVTCSMDKSNSLLSIGFNLFLVLLGTVLIFVMIRYQEWHIIYVNDSIILQRMLCLLYNEEKEPKLDRELIKTIFFGRSNKTEEENLEKKVNEKGLNKVYRFGLKKGAEYFFFNSFLLINYTILLLFIIQSFKFYNNSYGKPYLYISFLKWINQHFYLSTLAFTTFFVFTLYLYLYLFNHLKNEMIKEIEDKYLDKSWILSGFR